MKSKKEYMKVYIKKNRSRLKENWDRYYRENKEELKVKAQKRKLQYPEKLLITNAKVRAKKKGIPFNIDVSDINIPKICPVLGIPLVYGVGKFSPNSPSLDRIDNTKGYVKGNVLVISYRANSLKKDATLQELRSIAEFYSNLL